MNKLLIAALTAIVVAGAGAALVAPASAGTDLMQSYYIR